MEEAIKMIGESCNLRQAGIAIGKSVEDAAAAAYGNPKTICSYETGRQSPNVYMAIRIADCCNRSVYELINPYS